LLKRNMGLKGALVFIVVCLCICVSLCFWGISYYLKYLSFSENNVLPKQEITNYLSQTYGGEFVLQEQKFYKEEGYHIWEYKFVDENGLEFYEYYEHPIERPLDRAGVYVFFDRKINSEEIDFYWTEKIKEVYAETLHIEKYQLDNSPHVGRIRYVFDIQKNDINEIASIIAQIYMFTFENVKKPENSHMGCRIKYKGKRICTIGATPSDEIYQYIGEEEEAILQYIYQRISEECKEYFEKS